MKKLSLAALSVCALMAAGHTEAAVNLVSNGDFDANSPATNTAPLDWILTQGAGETLVVGDEIGVFSAPNAANFAGPGTASNQITQAVTLVGGQRYILSFELAEGGTNSGNQFRASIGHLGKTITTASAFDFKLYTLSFTAPVSDPYGVSFTAFDNGGWYALDDVSLVAAPEPTTWALMLAGFAGLGAALRNRRTRPAPNP